MKWFGRPLLIRDVLGHPGNGHWSDCILVGKLTSYTRGRCSIWLTGCPSQSISVSVPFNCLWWAIMEPSIISNPQSRNDIRHYIWSWQVSPSPLILWLKDSYDTPAQIAPSWKVMVLYFTILAMSPTLLKSPMITLIAPWIHSGSLDPRIPQYESNTPMHRPTPIPTPSWVAG